jgi:hypothetical protein
MKKIVLFASFFLITCSFLLFSQTDSIKHETETKIPALEDFHEIIYPIWHTFYPEKDYKSLRGVQEDINSKAEKIYSVKLPGILREKQTKWNTGISDFKKAVIEYNEMVKGNDDKGLLDAAEKLHSKYEMLIRIINPSLKEIDNFHKTLYVIYHKYLPEKDYKKINTLTGELLTKAEAITKVKLNKRFEAKTTQFNEAANNLLTSVKELIDISEKGDGSNIEKAVEKMHSNYEKLDAVFTK